MGIKKNIRKILSICFWCLAGTGVIILLVAAVNFRNEQTCRGYQIDINGANEGHWFIDKEDILKVLTNRGSMRIRGRSIRSFDLNRLETQLKKEVWIRDADMFIDNNGILKVKVEEREPVARIFSSSGESFYIDSTGHRLPLSDKMSARLPVFTGFPGTAGKKLSVKDKQLVKGIKDVSLYLLNDPFWMAQIAQVDITPAREFEMVPTIGNHLIEFGKAENYKEKFRRLKVFYKQVLAKTGMEKYARIKVQYDQQVIGVKKGNNN